MLLRSQEESGRQLRKEGGLWWLIAGSVLDTVVGPVGDQKCVPRSQLKPDPHSDCIRRWGLWEVMRS